MSTKTCSKCKIQKDLIEFNKCKTNKDGYHYQCKSCRKAYNQANKGKKTQYNKEYFAKNKEVILKNNKAYRDNNVAKISAQRKDYRKKNKIKIQTANKNYNDVKKKKIKERRQNDLSFRLTEILRSKIHKMIRGRNTSYRDVVGCDFENFRKWIEFQFDENMTWENLGIYWQIDHILPINQFNLHNEYDMYVCFNWTNLQPLRKEENREKSDKIMLHYYFNSIVSVHRFMQCFNVNTTGYQFVNKSLHWLREKLRYGKNATDK